MSLRKGCCRCKVSVQMLGRIRSLGFRAGSRFRVYGLGFGFRNKPSEEETFTGDYKGTVSPLWGPYGDLS